MPASMHVEGRSRGREGRYLVRAVGLEGSGNALGLQPSAWEISMNVGDFLVKRLSAWGVRTVYGYPGDGINGIMGALNRDAHGIRFIQARHEVEGCLATSGPAAIRR